MRTGAHQGGPGQAGCRAELKALIDTLNEPLRVEIRHYYQSKIARAGCGKERTDVIVCAPGSDTTSSGSIQCQRLPNFDQGIPGRIAPPITPDGAPSTRPVM